MYTGGTCSADTTFKSSGMSEKAGGSLSPNHLGVKPNRSKGRAGPARGYPGNGVSKSSHRLRSGVPTDNTDGYRSNRDTSTNRGRVPSRIWSASGAEGRTQQWRSRDARAPAAKQQAASRPQQAQGKNALSVASQRAKQLQWRPKNTPRIEEDDIIVVLKPRETLDLKATFGPGQAGAAVRSILGADASVGLAVWPLWDQNCIPSCLLCGGGHKTGSSRLCWTVPAAGQVGIPTRIQAEDNRGGRGGNKQAPTPKTGPKKAPAAKSNKPEPKKTNTGHSTNVKSGTPSEPPVLVKDFPPLTPVQAQSTGSASSAAPYTGPALRGPRGKASNSHQRQSRDAPTAANSGTVEEIRERQCIQQRVPHESRVHLVMPALTERVRYLLRNLNPEESADYESIKAAVLTELKLSPAEYLQKVRKSTLTCNCG
ncbi:hypothetical protein MRX96_011379 [Rhipicephalus microplus]